MPDRTLLLRRPARALYIMSGGILTWLALYALCQLPAGQLFSGLTQLLAFIGHRFLEWIVR